MRRPAGTTPARRPRPEHVGKEMDEKALSDVLDQQENGHRDPIDRNEQTLAQEDYVNLTAKGMAVPLGRRQVVRNS